MEDHYYDGPDFSEKRDRDEEKEIKGEQKFEHDRNHKFEDYELMNITPSDKIYLRRLLRSQFDLTALAVLEFEGKIKAKEIIRIAEHLGFYDLAKEMEDDL